MNDWQVYTVGFIAQLLFTCRFLVQWIASEKAKKVMTPSLFWKFSLLGSFFLFIYGVLRSDLVIMVGQVLIVGIYIRNLHLKGKWKKISGTLGLPISFLPLIALLFVLFSRNYNPHLLLSASNFPVWLLLLGFSGQAIFSLRFVIQWLYSEKRKNSVLPLPFWILSLTGSTLILLYALFRKDPVLILGNLAGIFVYIRNISLSRSSYVSG